MTLGFGLLSAQLRPGESDWTRAYDDTVRLAVEAERLAFSSVWTTEHHFVDDGYMPSLLVVSAALAQATSRIEIGTGVILAPMHHPLRLAEDAATVQLLSHGRLVLGLGLGWSEVEYAGLGADMRRRGAAMEETLRILPQAWTGQPFTHEGSVYQLPTLAVRPTPSTRIPILIGGGAEPALRRAARLADGIFSNAPADEFGKQVGWVLDELEQAGRDPATFRFIHYSILLPGASRADALARYRDAVWGLNWKYSDMEASATRSLPAASPPPFEGDDERLLARRTTHAGTTDRAGRGAARGPATGAGRGRVRGAQPPAAARVRRPDRGHAAACRRRRAARLICDPIPLLLRGINVGGRNKVPMAALRDLLESHGHTKVSTYIASGNVILSSDRSAAAIKRELEDALPKTFKLDSELIAVLVLTLAQLRAVVRKRPKGFGDHPETYHSDAVFLIDIDAKTAMKVFDPRPGVDEVWPGTGVIYSQRLSAQRTKSRLGKIVGTPAYKSMTIRSWQTTLALLERMEAPEADAVSTTGPTGVRSRLVPTMVTPLTAG